MVPVLFSDPVLSNGGEQQESVFGEDMWRPSSKTMMSSNHHPSNLINSHLQPTQQQQSKVGDGLHLHPANPNDFPRTMSRKRQNNENVSSSSERRGPRFWSMQQECVFGVVQRPY